MAGAELGDSTERPPVEASARPMKRPKAPIVVVVKFNASRRKAVLDFISSLFHSPSGLADGLALKEFALRILRFAPEIKWTSMVPPIR